MMVDIMDVLYDDLTGLCIALNGRIWAEKRFDGLFWLVRNCGNHEEILEWLSTVIPIMRKGSTLLDGKRKHVMDKQYMITGIGYNI